MRAADTHTQDYYSIVMLLLRTIKIYRHGVYFTLHSKRIVLRSIEGFGSSVAVVHTTAHFTAQRRLQAMNKCTVFECAYIGDELTRIPHHNQRHNITCLKKVNPANSQKCDIHVGMV